VTAVTDSNGTAAATATINLSAGVYKISAAFAGDDYYYSAASSASPYVVWEPIAGLSAKGSGKIDKAGVEEAEFGFHIKYEDGRLYPEGELEYEEEIKESDNHQHDNEIELESTSIDWLIVSDNVTIFEGQAKFEHQNGSYTFRVIAFDNGKPGAGIDTFELYIDGLLYSGGTLVKGDIRLKD